MSKTRRKIEKLEKRLKQEKTKIQLASTETKAAPTLAIHQDFSEETVHVRDPDSPDSKVAESTSSLISSDPSSTSENTLDHSTSSGDSSSSDEPPEYQPVSLQVPHKVPPPKREPAATPVCHNIARFGRCRKPGCRFRHEKSEMRHHVKEDQRTMSLYQKLVRKEKVEENKTVLAAIIHLGQQGRLGKLDMAP